MSGADPNFGHSGSKVSSIDRDSFAINSIELPGGCDHRTFMVRSAQATAIAALPGNPIAVFAQAPVTALSSGMSQNLNEKLTDEELALVDLVILDIVLVPGLTDDPEEMRSLAEFGASLGVVERVEILPFHQMGRYKWERLSKPYSRAATEPPSAAEVDKAVNAFREFGLKAA